MRILFIRSGYGKPDSRFEKEVAVAVDARHDVNIIAWDRTQNIDKKHNLKIFTHEVPCIHIGVRSELSAGFKKNFIPMCKFNYRLFKLLKKNNKQYDLIHASDFDTVLPGYYAKVRYKKKLVYDIYDYYVDSHHIPRIIKGIIRSIDNKIISNSDAVIICNEKRIQQIKPATPRKLYIIHNSPELCLCNEFPSIAPKKRSFRIVFIGGIAKKGRYIFEMIEAVRERNDCELIIGGFGSGEDEIKLISQNNENIIFIGKQDYEDVLSIENTADVLTALYDPSLHNHKYAAPNKFYEALMLGKPIICAKNTNIDKIVNEESIGWVLDIPENDFISEFNRALDKAIYGGVDLKKISERTKKIFIEKYDWKIMKERLYHLYKNI